MSAGRRLSKEQRQEAELDLSHWGAVARRRWRCERTPVHPIFRMMELGITTGPTQYGGYDYEPDDWFHAVNLIVMRLPTADREVLAEHYIQRKPWKRMMIDLGCSQWWDVGRLVRAAEVTYLLAKVGTTA